MDYKPRCKETGKKQGDYRFLLEQPGEKMLFVIGLNPSTADETKPDPTLRRIMKCAEANGYDAFAVLNLSAERRTYPRNLSRTLDETRHAENLRSIAELASRCPQADVLVAFGNGIDTRTYLKRCFGDIYETLRPHVGKWLHIGTFTRSSNPRHPLRLDATLPLEPFDVEAYLQQKIQ